MQYHDTIAVLHSACIGMEIRPFARFVAQRVEWSLEQAARGVELLKLVCARLKDLSKRGKYQMSAINWLEENAPGFRGLSEEERNAIMQFSLLWSLFEARALNTYGNANSILKVSKRWEGKGLLTEQTFKYELAYFQNRYFTDGRFTYHFDHLNLHPADKPDLVKAVLRGEVGDLGEVAATLLIIVYCLRNNFFHGVKWAYEIRDQLANFNHGNSVLMLAVELHESAARL